MSWKIGFLVGLMGCAPDTVAPGAQDLGDFESWGEGIENFVAAPVTDTGSAGTTDATYDGGYVGTFNMTLSYNGYVCSFSNVSLQVLINSGLISTPFMPVTSADCDLTGGGTNTYTPQVYFEGTVGAGGVVSGTVYEDNQFVFEGAWAGMVMDLGAGAYQISAEFNEFPRGS